MGSFTPTGTGDAGTIPANSTLQELVARYDRLVSDNKPGEAALFYQKYLATHFNR